MPKTHISGLYKPPFGLLLDLYHLTMAYGFWKNGMADRQAAFHLFFRKTPFGHPYVLAGGLALVIDLLEDFRYGVEDIQYLGTLQGANGQPLFDEAFLNYLQRMDFQCSIDALPEGTVVFPHQPLLRTEGPLLQVQIIESAMLNVINFSSLIATKAARMVAAAPQDSILEFGLRRAQGIDGALTAARSAYLGGCHATSNVMAGRYYDIPVKGTHAHSWVMCFEEEIDAFRAFARALPHNCIFLVDTYDSLQGVRNAIRVGRDMRKQGLEMNGIRLDSGDLAQLSIEARRMLDEAGFPEVDIVASDSVDEYRLAEMKKRGAQVSIWGIGTRLVTANDDPALGGVYKLSALQNEDGLWEDRIKLSEETIKISNPGRQQVRRFFDPDGKPVADMIFDPYTQASSRLHAYDGQDLGAIEAADHRDLLVPVFRSGKLVYRSAPLPELRQHALRQQELFRHLQQTTDYTLGLEKGLYHRKQDQIRKLQSKVADEKMSTDHTA